MKKKKIRLGEIKKSVSCCAPSDGSKECCPPREKPTASGQAKPPGKDNVPRAEVRRTGPVLSLSDRLDHARCRLSSFRTRYAVEPGLYAIGTPDSDSDVFVSANYKLSFDKLRSSLGVLDAWILVLDTKGINVWCAAGKGTFGTDELIARIFKTRLHSVVGHRRLILPQLGAPGVAAHEVRKQTGFTVRFGPVRASDIPAYIKGGYKATQDMRTVRFPLTDRLVLTPMEIIPALKIYPFYAIILLAVFGLSPVGVFSVAALAAALPFLFLGVAAVLAGALLTPALLPLIPFRSFAVKGWIAGMAVTVAATLLPWVSAGMNTPLYAFTYLFYPMLSSFVALQFTGSTTFTGISGVKAELKVAMPLYISSAAVSVVLLAAYKLGEWGVV